MSENQVTPAGGQSPTLLYIGYALAFFFPPGAIILGFVARSDFRDTPYDGHCDNLIQMVWVSIVLTIAGSLLAAIGIGLVIFAWLTIWYLIRLIKGLVAVSKNEPYVLGNPFWI
ncbi:MAG: hypothetical protein ABF335_07675 [Alphaproteobacteria bacterium]